MPRQVLSYAIPWADRERLDGIEMIVLVFRILQPALGVEFVGVLKERLHSVGAELVHTNAGLLRDLETCQTIDHRDKHLSKILPICHRSQLLPPARLSASW